MKRKMEGVVLLISLLFLLILTMLGITAMNLTILSEKMTNNLRESVISFNSTEMAITNGEHWLQSQMILPVLVSNCSQSPCLVWQKNILPNFTEQSLSWWQSNATPYSDIIHEVAQTPYYIIEQINFAPYDLSLDAWSQGYGYYYYQITAQGTGETLDATTLLQSIYATQFN